MVILSVSPIPLSLFISSWDRLQIRAVQLCLIDLTSSPDLPRPKAKLQAMGFRLFRKPTIPPVKYPSLALTRYQKTVVFQIR